MRCLCWVLVSTAVMMLSGYEGGGSAPQQPAAKMTAEDYDAIMKNVGPAFASMRKNLEGEGDAINRRILSTRRA
jgi:cytochrome c556